MHSHSLSQEQGQKQNIIERKPETERNRFYRLLHPQPEFYGLILNYEENLKQFPEFSDYDRIMHEDFVLEEKVKPYKKVLQYWKRRTNQKS